MLKRCSKCGEEKELICLYENTQYAGGRNSRCKTCLAVVAKERYKRNIKTISARMSDYRAKNRLSIRSKYRAYYQNNKGKCRDSRLRRTYGIDQSKYDELNKIQGNSCAICNKPPPFSKMGVLHIDHDHKTGEIRGLLCPRCNMILSLVENSPEILAATARYLTCPPASEILIDHVIPPR